MEIVPIQNEHLNDVLAIERDVFRDPWPRSAFSEIMALSDKCWVLAEDKTVVGYLLTQWVLDEIHILNIAVARRFQGKRLSKLLMKYLLDIGTQQGMRDVFLEVRVTNTAARSLYERFGFLEVSRRKNYYADGEDALIMHANVAERATDERPSLSATTD
jgi:[ribosomal protein S18]-alanine N-acetyltransferase